jgi:NAD(P)-dependent dehydrogenase (short-subunit alcohol dehydrogenase family)
VSKRLLLDFADKIQVDQVAYAPIPDNDMSDYDRVLAINATGILHCTRSAIAIMEKQEPRTITTRAGNTRELSRGVIVNVTSALSFAAVPGKVAYIASKHAALGITKATGNWAFLTHYLSSLTNTL